VGEENIEKDRSGGKEIPRPFVTAINSDSIGGTYMDFKGRGDSLSKSRARGREREASKGKRDQ